MPADNLLLQGSSVISLEDVARAQADFRRDAPPTYRQLLDAKVTKEEA